MHQEVFLPVWFSDLSAKDVLYDTNLNLAARNEEYERCLQYFELRKICFGALINIVIQK